MILPKVLISKTIAGAHKRVNDNHKSRYNRRVTEAKQHNLNFRYKDEPIRARRGVRPLLKSLHYPDYLGSGKCLVCGENAPCGCKVEVMKVTQ